MKKISKNWIILIIAVAVLLAAYAGTSIYRAVQARQLIQTPGLDGFGTITIYSREEGSGTRDTFTKTINMQVKAEDGTVKDTTAAQAVIHENAEEIIAAVRQDKNGIGYVSFGALSGQLDGIKVIRVNQIELNQKNVKNGRYPISRELAVAYGGKMTAVEEDFMRYIRTEGQQPVSEKYVNMRSPGLFLSEQPQGSISVNGSTTVAPLLRQLAEQYQQYNSGAVITIEETDSSTGLSAAALGRCDWGMTSRSLYSYEKELLTSEVIAKDGIAVLVNAENPVETLNLKQLRDIYTGADEKWSDINQ